MNYMISVFYIEQTILFLHCIFWAQVSAQCSDPLIYRLDDIHRLIANLTANQENCTVQIANMVAKQEKQEKEITHLNAVVANLTEQMQKQEEERTGL